MASIPYSTPSVFLSGASPSPDSNAYPVTSGTTLIVGDIAAIASGALTKPSANAASGFAGLMLEASNAAFVAPSQPAPFRDPMGDSMVGTLTSADPTNCAIAYFHGNQPIEISLSQATTINSTLGGTAVGINYDTTSGFFFADPSLSNKVATILFALEGPQQQYGLFGTDTGGRVVIAFDASALGV